MKRHKWIWTIIESPRDLLEDKSKGKDNVFIDVSYQWEMQSHAYLFSCVLTIV